MYNSLVKKTLIISDTHLTTIFDLQKFEYLSKLISEYEEVIINGDFWSYYSCTFDEFVNSEWNKLFSILKSKTIYLYGNHDMAEWMDERMNLFSKEQHETYTLKNNNVTLEIEHGHKIKWNSLKNETFIKYHRKLKIGTLNDNIQKLILKWFGTSFYNSLGKSLENKFIAHNRGENTLVVGHLHAPEYIQKAKYINTGYINFGNAYYVTVTDNEINLNYEKY